MPALFTYDEFEKLNKEAVFVPSPEKITIEKVNKQVMEYFYLYPENPANGFYNGKYIVEIEDKKKELEIIEGKIITTDERVASRLEAKGFILMYKREVHNGKL
jgi:hypothetical protein